MKKCFLFSLATSVISLFFQSSLVFAEDFSDVPKDHAYYTAIMYVRDAHIVNGYDDNTFRADQAINRAEFVKIIINAVFDEDEINGCETSNFDDIPVSEWYAKFICVALKHNIVSGYDDGLFHPEDNITFAEGAKIIVLGFGYEIDTTDIKDWYEPYVKALESRNAIDYGILTFDMNLKRYDMAEMIYRLKNNITDQNSRTYEELANPVRYFVLSITGMKDTNTEAEGAGSINLKGKKVTFYNVYINNFKNEFTSAYIVNLNTEEKIYNVVNFSIDENDMAYATGSSLGDSNNLAMSDIDFEAFKNGQALLVVASDKYPNGEVIGTIKAIFTF